MRICRTEACTNFCSAVRGSFNCVRHPRGRARGGLSFKPRLFWCSNLIHPETKLALRTVRFLRRSGLPRTTWFTNPHWPVANSFNFTSRSAGTIHHDNHKNDEIVPCAFKRILQKERLTRGTETVTVSTLVPDTIIFAAKVPAVLLRKRTLAFTVRVS